MHPHHESKRIAAGSDAVSPNPIHVVGSIAAKDLAAARSEALQPFHLSLDEADRNLRALLPKKRPAGSGQPQGGVTTDESPAFSDPQSGSVGPVDSGPSPPFALWAPWYMDAADQPA